MRVIDHTCFQLIIDPIALQLRASLPPSRAAGDQRERALCYDSRVLHNLRHAVWLTLFAAGCALPHASLRRDDAADDLAVEDATDAESDGSIDSPDSSDAIDVTIDTPDAPEIDAARDAMDVPDAVDAPADRQCPPGQMLCGASCVDTVANTLHCGRCDGFCPTSVNGIASCAASRCGLVCNAGYRLVYDMSGTPNCVTDVSTAASSCPGQMIDLAPGTSQSFVGTTEGRPGMRVGGGSCAMLSGPEAVFNVTAREAGVVRVTMTSFESMGFYVIGGTCGGALSGAQVACSYEGPTMTQRARTRTTVFEATAGQVFTVVVDSPAGAPQPFSLTVNHVTNCGFSTITSSMTRTCGDGNATGMDGCSATCSIEAGLIQTTCGGITPMTPRVVIGSEPSIFEGNWTGGGGMFSACGGGHDRSERIVAVDVPVPTSLRIDLKPGDSSRTALLVRRSMCSNSTGELCSNNVDETASGERVDITTTMPNERLFVIMDTDRDAPYTLRFTPQNCGDGRLAAGEQCDDGDTSAGDGCDSNCRVEARCDLREGATDTVPTAPFALPSDCDSLRFGGRIDPAAPDRDDAVRLYLRAGQNAAFQLSSGGQGRCPRGVDPVIEVSRGSISIMPSPRNTGCVNNFAAICVDDSVTYCPDSAFTAPADDWYTFRVFRYGDGGSAFDYELLLTRR